MKEKKTILFSVHIVAPGRGLRQPPNPRLFQILKSQGAIKKINEHLYKAQHLSWLGASAAPKPLPIYDIHSKLSIKVPFIPFAMPFNLYGPLARPFN